MKILIKKLLIVPIIFFSPQFLFAEGVKKLEVLTCEPEWAALVTALGGDFVNVTSATTYLQDPHHIQARPSLIAKARTADLLICSGAGLEEGWLPLLLQKSSNPKIQKGKPAHFMASEQVQLLGQVVSVDRSDGHVHGIGNPHIHLNPLYMLEVANALNKVLIELKGEQKNYFENNLTKFSVSLKSAIVNWQPRIQTLKNKKAIVHHEDWLYLFEWLTISNVGTLEPKPGLPPSTRHLEKLLVNTKNTPIDFIIYSSYQDARPAQWLSNQSKVPAIQLPYSVDDWKKQDALILWYDTILNVLTKNVGEKS